MTTGVRGFTTEGREAVKYSFELFEAGDYDLKLISSKAEVKKAADPGKKPRVGVRWEVLGTAKEEGGKNRLLFHDFYTSLKPGKDGHIMPQRAAQVVGLAAALGETFATNDIIEMPDADENGNITGKSLCINPAALQRWLMDHDGVVVRAHVKKKAASGGYEAKNELDYYIPAEEEQSSGLEEEASGLGEAEVETAPEEVEEEPVPRAPSRPNGVKPHPAAIAKKAVMKPQQKRR